MCALLFSVVCTSLGYAKGLGDLLKDTGIAGQTSSKAGPDNKTTASGLKEALEIGTGNAVKSVSRTDGYFGNQLVKILLPDKIQKTADVLSKMGYQKQVDDFILSMNRAAEKAAPKAVALFVDAIKGMNFDDAQKILQGSDTAATDYFKTKTSQKLHDAFKPTVSATMNQVGVTRSYKEMMGKADGVPFISKESVDLDNYVTNKTLDGLFTMVGQEEKNIRTNPAARTTGLLKSVFGK
ncbi:MAG: DUF4197 domain-containing protein [Syntrophus sp. (in: bacteria)]|nr:DUF4197 domain-containing protein [Syntrophus sp. (in: bacteria)]